MYVKKFCTPRADHPFWRVGLLFAHLMSSSVILTAIFESLWIDLAQGHEVDPQFQTRPEITPLPIQVEMAEEAARARQLCDSAKTADKCMLEDARMGRVVEMGDAMDLLAQKGYGRIMSRESPEVWGFSSLDYLWGHQHGNGNGFPPKLHRS
ncbi:DUF3391 domain-containing protein [Pseudomonas luteola]|uniref:DUF3391 domain-containing protein n=1 Tax=Pseudomonas TaxID=286 RepID=UPI000566C01E|nr:MULTISPECIES: DUF3391 domain-containing protein [Pseudomonas]RRW39647.1 DUF3391 domain-containing protein [Pseudomonas luteola]